MGERAPAASAVLCVPTLLIAEKGKQRRWVSRAEDWAREERRRGRGGRCVHGTEVGVTLSQRDGSE